MLIVLILLYVGSQLVSTLIATATADPNQRRLMLLLPLVFVVILYSIPPDCSCTGSRPTCGRSASST